MRWLIAAILGMSMRLNAQDCQIGSIADVTAVPPHSSQVESQAPLNPHVEIIVEPSLYASAGIAAAVDQYMADVRGQGILPSLITASFSNPLQLRQQISSGYQTGGLQGVLLVGDLPVP